MLAMDFISNKTALAIIAGIGYAVATLMMKMAAENTTALIVGSIFLILAVVVVAEILLLRQIDLGVAYIAIMATETLLVLAATYFVGQPLSFKELTGGAFVVLGVALVSF
jgi:small multidrug resistance pump